MQNDYREKLNELGILGIVTYGNSMWPFIKNKKTSIIVLKKENRLSRLDVAFYMRENGEYVLHRVLEVKEAGYIVCGDSQTEKEYVSEDSVIGILSGYYKGGKYVDCSDEAYKKAVEKWLTDPNREKKIKRYYNRLTFIPKIKSKIKRLFSFGKRK